MKKIFLICLLELPCLFRKARINLKVLKKRLGFPNLHRALRFKSALIYFNTRGFPAEKSGVFGKAYLRYQVAWTSPLCLMMLLCCTSPTLSKSAQSPPEPSNQRSAVHVSPHSGDNHRGGDSSPDTFSQSFDLEGEGGKAFYTTEVATIDGGPVPRTSVFGFPSPNDRTVPLPVSVSDVSGGHGDLTGLPSSVSRFLSDPSATQGREKSILSDRMEDAGDLVDRVVDTVETTVIWGRVSEYSDRSQMRLDVFSDFFFESTKAPNSNSLLLPLKNGMMMEGAYGKDKSFQYSFDRLENPVWINLGKLNSSPVLHRFLVFPGDTLQVFIDLESVSVVFAGPQADTYTLQYELRQLERQNMARTPPVLYTDQPEQVLKDPTYARQYAEAKAVAGPLVQIRERDTDQLAQLQEFDPFFEGGLLSKKRELINEYRGRVPDSFLDFLIKEAEIKAWFVHLSGLHSAWALGEKTRDSAVNLQFKKLAKEHTEKSLRFLKEGVEPYSASIMDFWKVSSALTSKLHEGGLFAATDLIPSDYWKEKYRVRLMYENFQSLDDADQSLQTALNESTQEDFFSMLQTLQNTTKKGVEVEKFEFLDSDGNTVGLEQMDGAEVVLVEFWITGCKVCVAFNEQTSVVLKERFSGDPRFKILTVSADYKDETWRASLESGKYTQPEFTNLYTGELNRNHPFLKHYGIASYPNRILLDGEGRILQLSQVPFSADELIPLIESYLSTPATAGLKPKYIQ